MAKQIKYATDTIVTRGDKLTGLDADNNYKTKNFDVGTLSDFIQEDIDGLYKVGTYVVDKATGIRNTEVLKAGNTIYGRGSFLNGDYIIADVLIDNPTTDAHLKPIFRG
jgi:hypothetical protein